MTPFEPDESRRVDEAVAAVRDLPVPPGPPPYAVERVLAAGAAAGFQPRRVSLLERIALMDRKYKMSAAAVFCVVTALAVWVLLPTPGSVAWADVVQRLNEVKTVAFKVTIAAPDGQTMVFRNRVRQPDRMRMETDKPLPVTNIVDMTAGKMMVLVHPEKVAQPVDVGDQLRTNPGTQDWFGRIKKLLDAPREEIGRREVSGVRAVGYKVSRGKETMTVWIDPATDLPVEMDFRAFAGGSTITVSDWEFDRPMDESLFELKAPEGYALREPMNMSRGGSLEDVAATLKLWVDARGGTFPDDLAPTSFTRDYKQPADEKEQQRVAQILGKGFMFLGQHRNAVYAGKGVKLNAPDTPVYWYQPKGAKTYKVLYADLTVRDVEPEALPGTRPTTGR